MPRLLTVLGDQELTATDRVVYAVIHTVTATIEEFSKRTPEEELFDDGWRMGVVFRMANLCQHTGLQPLAVRRAIKRLEARGWLTAEYDPRAFAWSFALHEIREEVSRNG